MEKRLNMKAVEAAGYKAMLAFENYLETLPLKQVHKDLIKIRASQINNCSFCIDMHTSDARKAGETEQRIYALTAWRETPFFTDDEQAVLALTEEVTLITQRVSDKTYSEAIKTLGEKYTAQVMMAAIGINAWNRIGVATNMAPVLVEESVSVNS
jgi:AhpD family alkylhydroperoxidase